MGGLQTRLHVDRGLVRPCRLYGPAPRAPHQNLFELFDEIGMINQLGRTRFELELPSGLTLS